MEPKEIKSFGIFLYKYYKKKNLELKNMYEIVRKCESEELNNYNNFNFMYIHQFNWYRKKWDYTFE